MKPQQLLFELKNVSVSFSGRPLFENLSFSVAAGEKIVLRGPSGCGKSTVLKLLLGFAQPTSGEVFVEGPAMTPVIAWEIRSRIAYADQKVDIDSGKVSDFLTALFDFKNTEEDSVPDSEEIAKAMKQFDLSPDLLEKEIETLSGGELQRIVLTSITLPNRSIYLLDEPTSALDGKRKKQVADFFLNSSDTVIVASHDEAWNRPDGATVIEMSPLLNPT